MKQPLIIIAAAALGLGAGFALRASRPAASPALSQTGAALAAPKPPPPVSSQKTARSILAEETAANLSLSEGVLRWLHWMTAVEKAQPGDFAALVRLAGPLPGAQEMLAARWMECDPHGMLHACLHEGSGFPGQSLLDTLFQTWPHRDPDAVLALLGENSDLPHNAVITALNSLFQIRPEQALIATSQLGIDSFRPGMNGIKAWAKADPLHAAQVASAHPPGSMTQDILKTIGEEWARQDPAAAVSFALSGKGHPARLMADHVMRMWTESNRDAASSWLNAADDDTREKLLPAFLGV